MICCVLLLFSSVLRHVVSLRAAFFLRLVVPSSLPSLLPTFPVSPPASLSSLPCRFLHHAILHSCLPFSFNFALIFTLSFFTNPSTLNWSSFSLATDVLVHLIASLSLIVPIIIPVVLPFPQVHSSCTLVTSSSFNVTQFTQTFLIPFHSLSSRSTDLTFSFFRRHPCDSPFPSVAKSLFPCHSFQFHSQSATRVSFPPASQFLLPAVTQSF